MTRQSIEERQEKLAQRAAEGRRAGSSSAERTQFERQQRKVVVAIQEAAELEAAALVDAEVAARLAELGALRFEATAELIADLDIRLAEWNRVMALQRDTLQRLAGITKEISIEISHIDPEGREQS